jgi:hypothetical protein
MSELKMRTEPGTLWLTPHDPCCACGCTGFFGGKGRDYYECDGCGRERRYRPKVQCDACFRPIEGVRIRLNTGVWCNYACYLLWLRRSFAKAKRWRRALDVLDARIRLLQEYAYPRGYYGMVMCERLQDPAVTRVTVRMDLRCDIGQTIFRRTEDLRALRRTIEEKVHYLFTGH